MKLPSFLRRFVGADADHDLHHAEPPLAPEDADCLVDGKPISIAYHSLRHVRHVVPTDIFRATVTGRGKPFVHEETIGQQMTIDTVGVFRVKNALGFENAIGAVFGKRQK